MSWILFHQKWELQLYQPTQLEDHSAATMEGFCRGSLRVAAYQVPSKSDLVYLPANMASWEIRELAMGGLVRRENHRTKWWTTGVYILSWSSEDFRY